MPILVSPSPDPPWPSDGAVIAHWLERNLQHGEGDLEGQPFRLAPHLMRVLFRWFEYDPVSGIYVHNKGLIGWPKGSIKTEFAGALSLEHLRGPSRRRLSGTAGVRVSAVDGDQSNALVKVAASLIRPGSELAEQLVVNVGEKKSRIKERDGSGLITNATASIGKNDGSKTSLQVNDEVHEWDAKGTSGGAERYTALEQDTFKRDGARLLDISTAGKSLASLLGGLFKLALLVANGELVMPGFLVEWWLASDHWDLDDPDQLRCAIIEANPRAAGNPGFVDRLVLAYHTLKLSGLGTGPFIRKNLNRFSQSDEDSFLDITKWDERKATDRHGLPHEGAAVVLAFDGSQSGDTTGLTVTTITSRPYVDVAGHWARPEGMHPSDWRVPVLDVERTIEWACEHWTVQELAYDPAKWTSSIRRLEARGVPAVEFSQSDKRMGAAGQAFLEAVNRGQMFHSGNEKLRAHMEAARAEELDDWGVRPIKQAGGTAPYVDLAQCAVMGHYRALWWHFEGGIGTGADEPLIDWDD